MTAPDTKSALRRQCLQRRREVLPADALAWSKECSASLCRIITALPAARVIAGYMPIRGEVDITPALLALHAASYPLALPVTEGGDLLFYPWQPQDALEPGRYAVPQPSVRVAPITPDVLIVPLAGFDRTLHRLGYGKGYYDRALARLRAGNPGLLAIGAAFALQEVASIPAGPHDEPLDRVATQREILAR